MTTRLKASSTGPGFNQRFIGERSTDGRRIAGRWERGMGDAGDQWELDFPVTYIRRWRRATASLNA